MLDDCLDLGWGGRQSRFRGRAFEFHAIARPHQVHGAQTEEERDRRHKLEVKDRFQPDPSHLLDAARARDAVNQSSKQQRRDDGLDQAQKDIADDSQVHGDSGSAHTERNAGGHAEKDPRCQTHSALTPFQFGSQDVEEKHPRRSDQVDHVGG